MPAEWEPHERCWMAWPCARDLWGHYLPETRDGYAAVARAITRFEPVSMLTPPEGLQQARDLCGAGIEIVPWDLDDAWTRDIDPNFLVNGDGKLAASLFHFNAWGRKYDRYRKDAAMGRRLCEALGIRSFSSPLFMEGGGINVDGEGTLLTTEQCILNANRNPGLSKEEAEFELRHALGLEKVIWLPGDPLDTETDGHVDGIACFARPGVVMATHDPDPASEEYRIFQKNIRALQRATDADGRSLEIHFIEEAREIDAIGDRFCRSYINFYIANGGIVMPAYGIPSDQRAREVVEHCFPDHEIAQVDVRAIAYGGGGIHCITQQQPACQPA